MGFLLGWVFLKRLPNRAAKSALLASRMAPGDIRGSPAVKEPDVVVTFADRGSDLANGHPRVFCLSLDLLILIGYQGISSDAGL